MRILGIDNDKCSNCQACIKECTTGNYILDEKLGQTRFIGSSCLLCGHCIAVCPENAINYEDFKDIVIDLEDPKDSVSPEAMFKLILSKRSIRQYKKKEVPIETIRKIIESIRYAPTAINLRSIKGILISGEQKMGEFIDSLIDEIYSGEERNNLKKSRENGVDPFFHNAPHLIILHSNSFFGEVDATIAITYAMLYAETLGLGSCWIGGIQKFLAANKEKTKKILGVSTKISAIMTLGFPAVKFRRSAPRPPIRLKIME